MRSSICWSITVAVLFVAAGVAANAQSTCPPSCPIPGGGDPQSDCHAEFASPTMRLNYPPYDPAAPAPRTEVRCFDGDAGCDLDGVDDNKCVFDIDVCLHNADSALAGCVPAEVTAVSVADAAGADRASLQTAVDALLPATSNVCTQEQTLTLTLPDGAPSVTSTVQLSATTASGTDDDSLTLTCVRRGWPSHGYNNASHRASHLETQIGRDTVGNLREIWRATVGIVSATPSVGFGNVYISSYDQSLYAVDAVTGVEKWRYLSDGVSLGIQSTPYLTPDGRVVIGDSDGVVHCLDAHTGRLLWKNLVGNGEVDHFWSSANIANGRVFIGIASHSDQPCTRGRLVALDLDTGELLWTIFTVPERVCRNDTAVTCETSDDCGGAECVPGLGAGVTATVATDETGETVYMGTVGCYTSPSIGDSETMFRIDAATGNVRWKTRTAAPEQFGYCTNRASLDCGSDAVCGADGPCRKKALYHDFGFLNGPALVDADDGMGGTRRLVVAGSKHATLYAFRPEDGSIAWSRAVLPAPVSPAFAGFGLFNAAMAYDAGRLHAALYEMIPSPPPQPRHLQAFDIVDGSSLWADEIGRSWSSVTVANGLVFSGTQTQVNRCSNDESVECDDAADCGGAACVGRNPLFIHDAATGERLRTIIVPGNVQGGPSVVDGRLYVPISGVGGGVIAYGLSAAPACPGDCDGNGMVTVDELIKGVLIALGQNPLSTCPVFDEDGDGGVAINELIIAVNRSLDGCG